jgi:hypothetical protein
MPYFNSYYHLVTSHLCSSQTRQVNSELYLNQSIFVVVVNDVAPLDLICLSNNDDPRALNVTLEAVHLARLEGDKERIQDFGEETPWISSRPRSMDNSLRAVILKRCAERGGQVCREYYER